MGRTSRTFFILAVSSALLCTNANADSIWGEFDSLDEDNIPLPGEEKEIFAGRVQFGYLAATGNTNTTNLNGNMALGWDLEKWRHAVTAGGIYSKSEDVLVAEHYNAGYKADRKLGEQNYLFGSINLEQDEFSGYDERTAEAVGYGRRLLESDEHVLDAEIGAGARQTTLVDGTAQDEAIVRLAANYLWKFAENSQFSQKLAVESGDLNTYSESISSLTAQLLGELDLVVSYTIKRNSDVPLGLEKTDTYSSVNLQYTF